jgi:hypothetical protein
MTSPGCPCWNVCRSRPDDYMVFALNAKTMVSYQPSLLPVHCNPAGRGTRDTGALTARLGTISMPPVSRAGLRVFFPGCLE